MIDALFIWMYFSTARKWKLVLSLTPLKPKWLSLNNVSPHPLCNSPPLFISACFWSRVQDWLRSTFYYFIGFYVHLVNNRRSHPSRIFNRDDKFPAICSKIIFEILAFLFYIVFQRIVSTFFIRFQYRPVESSRKLLLEGLVVGRRHLTYASTSHSANIL